MKTVDFSKVHVKDIEGNMMNVDLSKELGNMMYIGAKDISIADLGHDIYHKKAVELTSEQAHVVSKYVEKGFSAIVKRELIPMLEAIK